MIKYYAPNAWGTHTVRYTFMREDYIGHISRRVGGNCVGADLLKASYFVDDTDKHISAYTENDCNFTFHDSEKFGYEEDFFTVVLTNASGNTLSIDCNADELAELIVCIEFTDYAAQKNTEE